VVEAAVQAACDLLLQPHLDAVVDVRQCVGEIFDELRRVGVGIRDVQRPPTPPQPVSLR
jgi:hypothetical protein